MTGLAEGIQIIDEGDSLGKKCETIARPLVRLTQNQVVRLWPGKIIEIQGFIKNLL